MKLTGWEKRKGYVIKKDAVGRLYKDKEYKDDEVWIEMTKEEFQDLTNFLNTTNEGETRETTSSDQGEV